MKTKTNHSQQKTKPYGDANPVNQSNKVIKIPMDISVKDKPSADKTKTIQEETLSDKIIHREIDTGVFGAVQEDNKLEVDDVKEFIKKLKEAVKVITLTIAEDRRLLNYIDDIAGEKLI